jgi:hypothetical protein
LLKSVSIVVKKNLEKNLLKVALLELFQKTETELQIEMVRVKCDRIASILSLNPLSFDPNVLYKD